MKYSDIYDACLRVTEGRSIETFVDLGARHGESFRLFGKHRNINRYVFVEPSPRCTPVIRKIVDSDPKKFSLVEGVLGNQDGEVTFYQLENDGDQSGNIFSDRGRSYGPATSTQVKMFDFRRVFNGRIDFLKCNIEGGEYQLIEDGLFDEVNSFVMEVHNRHVPGKTYLDAINGLVTKFDLEVWGNVGYKYCFINGNKKH